MIEEKVKELVLPILEERNLKLVDIEFIKGARPVLRIYIYNPEGTTIENCEWVSRRIGALLDIEDPIPYPYILEVSSPGLDRKLKNKDEYNIFKGRDIRIYTKEPVHEKTSFRGKLKGIENDVIKLEEEGETIDIPYDKVSSAKLEF